MLPNNYHVSPYNFSSYGISFSPETSKAPPWDRMAFAEQPGTPMARAASFELRGRASLGVGSLASWLRRSSRRSTNFPNKLRSSRLDSADFRAMGVFGPVAGGSGRRAPGDRRVRAGRAYTGLAVWSRGYTYIYIYSYNHDLVFILGKQGNIGWKHVKWPY